MTNMEDFNGYAPTWCPGCGDWGIGVGIKQALTALGQDPSSIGVVFDIGCSGNMNDFLNAYAVHGLHGRSIPVGVGMKLANHKMPVLVVGGDGGIYGEGGNHFVHASRGNHDITVIVHDNKVYGLTTGQVAPTSDKGMKTKSTPSGVIEMTLNPLVMAITQGATYVANAYAGDARGVIELIKGGISHKGFSLINILQPCVTFNKVNTYQYYMERTYKLDESYNKADFNGAIIKAMEMSVEKYPLGILYQTEKPAYHDQLPQLGSGNSLLERLRFNDFSGLLKDFV